MRNSIIIIIHLQTVQSLVQHPNTFINIKMKWNVDLYYCFLDILANNYRRNKKQTAVISIQGNINASSRVVFKASCWDHQAQVKLNLHCMTGKLSTLNLVWVNNHSSATYHVMSTGHNVKWHHFEILARGWSDTHCKIKEILLLVKRTNSLNENVSSEKLYLF